MASASPRRREILQTLGVPFEVCPALSEQPIDPTLPIEEAVLKTAASKAREVAKKFPDRAVLGADTVVVLPAEEGGEVLGKPTSPAHAAEMLRRLSGRNHRVMTAVYLCTPQGNDGFTDTVHVAFYPMSERDIADYLDSGEPFDKAGAYGIQGLGSRYVRVIAGDFFTVMGLPAGRLWQFLAKFRADEDKERL